MFFLTQKHYLSFKKKKKISFSLLVCITMKELEIHIK